MISWKIHTTSPPVLTVCAVSTNSTSPAVSSLEQGERRLLDLLRAQPRDTRDAVDEELARIRLDARELQRAPQPLAVGARRDQRRETAADLDHPSGSGVLEDARKDPGVERRILVVARVVFGLIVAGLVDELELVLGREHGSAELELSICSPVDANGLARRRGPQPLALRGQFASVVHRRVEVTDREAVRREPRSAPAPAPPRRSVRAGNGSIALLTASCESGCDRRARR